MTEEFRSLTSRELKKKEERPMRRSEITGERKRRHEDVRHDRGKEDLSEYDRYHSAKKERNSSPESSNAAYIYFKKKKDHSEKKFERKKDSEFDIYKLDDKLCEVNRKSSASVKRDEKYCEGYQKSDKYRDASKTAGIHNDSSRKNERYRESKRRNDHFSRNEGDFRRQHHTEREMHKVGSPKVEKSSSEEDRERRKYNCRDKNEREYGRSGKNGQNIFHRRRSSKEHHHHSAYRRYSPESDDNDEDDDNDEKTANRPAWETKAVMKRAQEIQQRKLMWSKAAEDKEGASDEKSTSPGARPSTSQTWSSILAATSSDSKQLDKFKRLMGMKRGEEKKDDQPSDVNSEQIEAERKRQRELFSGLDQQYAVARSFTHLSRGQGLGFH